MSRFHRPPFVVPHAAREHDARPTGSRLVLERVVCHAQDGFLELITGALKEAEDLAGHQERHGGVDGQHRLVQGFSSARRLARGGLP